MILVGSAPDFLGEQRRRDVIDAAGRAARPGDLRGIGLHGRRQVLGVLDRAVGGHHQGFVFGRQARDRGGLVEGDRGFVGEQRAHHHVAHDHELVAVALAAIDELRDADRAAGAGDVGDLGALGDAGLGQGLLHGARGLVPAAAGRCRRHDLEFHLRGSRGDKACYGRDSDGAAPETFAGMDHLSFPLMALPFNPGGVLAER